jgi:hypothetical protein
MNELKELLKYMYKDIIGILGRLYDKVVLAHSLSNVVWVYYGAIVFCVFYMVARWPA